MKFMHSENIQLAELSVTYLELEIHQRFSATVGPAVRCKALHRIVM